MSRANVPREGVVERRGPARARGRFASREGCGRFASRKGFSLVEVIVALMVLTIGLLGMAAATGWVIRTAHFGELETARSAAFRSAVEVVRSQPFADLESGSETFGDHTVTWTVGSPDSRNLSRPVEFVVVGPGRVSTTGGQMPELSNAVADTFQYRIMRRD